MKVLNIILVSILLIVPCVFAQQVWVKTDAALDEKDAKTAFEVTAKMKEDLLKLDSITLYDAQIIASKTGEGSIAEAKRIIDAMLTDKTIKTYESRYSELYTSAEELTP